MVAFVARQLRLQRRDAALLDLRPFTNRRFTVSLVLVALGFMSLFGAIIMMPLYIQDVLGRSAFVAGLVVLPGGLAMGFLGPFIGRAYDRFGARRLVLPGAILLCAALWTIDHAGRRLPALGGRDRPDGDDGVAGDDVHPADDRLARLAAR